MADPSLLRFRFVIEAALAHLESRRHEVNDLNVFPVADADTGTNMLFTMRSALAEAEKLGDHPHLHDEMAEVAAALARGALHGARGNSGMILSQILRGLAEVTAEAGVPEVDSRLFGTALAHAADLVVTALADGRTAAVAIHSYLEALPKPQQSAIVGLTKPR